VESALQPVLQQQQQAELVGDAQAEAEVLQQIAALQEQLAAGHIELSELQLVLQSKEQEITDLKESLQDLQQLETMRQQLAQQQHQVLELQQLLDAATAEQQQVRHS
jgi:chromosome segregation ATPase